MSRSARSNDSRDNKRHNHKQGSYVVQAFHSKIHNPVLLDEEQGDQHTSLFDSKALKKIDRPYKQSKVPPLMLNGFSKWGKKRSLTPKNNKLWRDIRKFCYDQEKPPTYFGLQSEMFMQHCTRKRHGSHHKFKQGKAFEEEWNPPPISTVHLWVTRFASENLVEFDSNGDGVLDKKECRPFVKKLYEAIKVS